MAEIKRSLAVVIGINQYFNNIAPLETAVNDAEKLANLLEQKYNYQVLLLLDKAATLSRLNDLLTTFTEQKLLLANGKELQLQRNDRLLFYFAGHGTPLDEENDTDKPTGYLIPQDGQRDNSNTWISMARLHDSLSELPCRHLLLILDCCFAGTFRWAAGHREVVRRQHQKLYRENYERYLSNRVQQVITSAAHDETAADYTYAFGLREKDNSGHSPFAEVLIRGLNGEADYTKDGVITAAELYVYLENELFKKNTKQTPELREFKRHEKGHYIFPLPDFDINLLPSEPKIIQETNTQQNLELVETRDRSKDPGNSHIKNNEQKSSETTQDSALRADWEYEQLVKQNNAYAKVIRNIMLRMVALDGDELARRRVLDDELVYLEPENTLVKQVITRFCAARLLLRGQDTQGNGYIEPADDNLVRQWSKLLTWKQQELGNLLLHRELTLSAYNWANQKQSKRAFRLLWANDHRFPLIKERFLKKDIWFNSLESEFIKRSIQRQRYQHFRNITVAVFGGALASLTILYLYRPELLSFNQQPLHEQTSLPTEPPTIEPNQLQPIDKVGAKNTFKAGNGTVNSLAFSPDGNTVIAGVSEGRLYLRNLQENSTRNLLTENQSPINSVAFHPTNSQIIAVGTNDGTLRIWDLKQNTPKTLATNQKNVHSVSFNSKGDLIATGGNDGRILLWNTQGKLFAKPIVTGKISINSVAFNPKRQVIIAGSNNGNVSIWNFQGQRIGKPFSAHPKRSVNVVNFTPDGKYIITGGKDGKVSIWNWEGKSIITFLADKKAANAVAFIDNGGKIITGGSEGKVNIWNWKGDQVGLFKDLNFVKSIAVSRDGKKLVIAGNDGNVKLHNLSKLKLTKP
ncbi:caspase family protein [Aerosakkonemataceae cyanobacterium BLCC-F50]|uniref:Caspase family protein n=1 Tax=Floridaenema flaviceps BLCC-F50 TaxID=3153642 RepID=A0ABV4Y0B7_9CYAN